jgi:hypothetical protein
VDELMALCDQLKNSLQQAQETQIKLTDVVVKTLFSSRSTFWVSD